MIKKILDWLFKWHRLDIVIDFDGTITTEPKEFPKPGRFKFMARWVLKRARMRHTLILNTCREGCEEIQPLEEILFPAGLYFDLINMNTAARIEKWGDCRKVTGDLGVDNLFGFIFWPWIAVKIWFMERGPGRW
jgi:hypothetical protein